MLSGVDIAIAGPNTPAGRLILELLEEREFPVNQLFLLDCEPETGSGDDGGGDADDEDGGPSLRFRGRTVAVGDIAGFDWRQAQLALFATGAENSLRWAPIAAEDGCVVIDTSGAFCDDPEIPLVIPEVNPELLAEFRHRNIIANPGSATVQLLLTLKPIHDLVGISRVNVVTFQSVSGSGKPGINELAGQTAQLLNGRSVEPHVYSRQIAFNLLPQIDALLDNGYTQAEMSMVRETCRILGDDNVLVNPTAVRVPVFYGDAQAVHLETRLPVAAEEVRALLLQAPGIEVFADDRELPTPVTDANGNDKVMVARIREDISHPQGIVFWNVADNLLRCHALNAVIIAERLVLDHM